MFSQRFVQVSFAVVLGAAVNGCATAPKKSPETSVETPEKSKPSPPAAAADANTQPPPNSKAKAAADQAIATAYHRLNRAAYSCMTTETCEQPAIAAVEVPPTASSRTKRAAAGLKIDLAVESVTTEPAVQALTIEEDQPGEVARFGLVDLWMRLADAEKAKRPKILAGASTAMDGQLQLLAPAFGIADRRALVGDRVQMAPKDLVALAERVLKQTDPLAAALDLHPADIPRALRDAAAATKVAPFTGPLFRGAPAPKWGKASGCFHIGPGTEGVVWTTPYPERRRAKSGLEQEARIRQASCAATLIRQSVREDAPTIADAIWVHALIALALDTSSLASGPDAARRRAIGRLLKLRRQALVVSLGLRDNVPTQTDVDSAATRWGAPNAKAVAGAGTLLDLDPAGRAAVRLVATLVASAVEHHLLVEHGGLWMRRGREADSLATIERLRGVFHKGGPAAVFGVIGEKNVDAAVFLTATSSALSSR